MPPTSHPDPGAKFAQDGFAVWHGFLDSQEVESVHGRLRQFISEVVPGMPAEQVFYEDKNDTATLKQIQKLNEHDDWFARMIDSGKLRALAEQLLGTAVIAQNLQYFSKPPGHSRPTPAHQDGFYFMLTPCEAITMWLALDDINEDNGCVRYVPGSHKQPMRPHNPTSTLGFSQGIADYPANSDRRSEVAIPVRSGDLLVHHALTIHRADANISQDRPRRALGFVYFSAAAKCDEKTHAAYQEQLRRKLKAAGRI